MGKFYKPNTEYLDAEFARDKREVAEQGEIRPMKLESGVTELRILPPFNERGAWYREIKEYFFENDGHYNRLTSPSQFGLPDPVAEKRQALLNAGGEANLAIAKDLQEQRAFLYNVIVKSGPPGFDFVPGKVYILKTGVKVKRALLSHDRDGQGGWADITNEENGVTFRIQKSGKGFKTDYQVSVCPNRTNIDDDLAACGMAPIGQEHLYNLDEMYPPLPEDEIKMRLLGMGPHTAPTTTVTAQQPQFQPVAGAPNGQQPVQQQPVQQQPVQQQPVQQQLVQQQPVQQQPTGTAGAPAPQSTVPTGTAVPSPAPAPVQQQAPTQTAPVQQQPVQQQPVGQPVEQAALPEIPAPPPPEEGSGF
jgi:hypothetical protein